MTLVPLPATLPALIAHYAGCSQGELRYNPQIWKKRLAGDEDPGFLSSALEDPTYSSPAPSGRRWTSRDLVERAIDASLIAGDAQALRRAFLLMYAWGNGSDRNGLRNGGRALADTSLVQRLRDVAETLRDPSAANDISCLETAIGIVMRVDGLGQTFASKWLAFAGRAKERPWQPLIIDSRVKTTLVETLGIPLAAFGPSPGSPSWYAAYVALMHEWARDAGLVGEADRLEWILFAHDGRPVGAV